MNYIHGTMCMEKKRTLGLENITLGVRKKNERNGSGWFGMLRFISG